MKRRAILFLLALSVIAPTSISQAVSLGQEDNFHPATGTSAINIATGGTALAGDRLLEVTATSSGAGGRLTSSSPNPREANNLTVVPEPLMIVALVIVGLALFWRRPLDSSRKPERPEGG